ncbi:MAG: glycerol-3-phosphate acyltransferase [Actinobacteria bacterium]|nr:glycerol-3-phosphate acyltransferase [Actinomycetota bacterium]MCI0679677.1 glycerol-3-phosphate acyltransferase [Actinomycetota bacterium]
MTLLAVFAGYLVGSLPTALWLGRWLGGIDLTAVGSGNPGANNALRSGGPALGAVVLVVEMAKGAGAVLLGETVDPGLGAVASGLGAVAGNLYSPWTGFRGGKGLGITGGVLAVAWPTVLGPIVVVIALAAWLTRSAARAALIAIAALAGFALLWAGLELPVGRGDTGPGGLLALAAGVGFLLWPRHRAGLRRPSPV